MDNVKNIFIGLHSFWQLISAIVGLVYGLLIAHFLISCLVNKFYDFNKMDENGKINTRSPKRDKLARIQSATLGAIERCLYLIALLFGQIGFIPIWISLKTAVLWSKWRAKEGRRSFNNFLIGNGLNLFFSFVSFAMIHLSIHIEKTKSFIIYLSLLVVSLTITIVPIIVLSCQKENIRNEFEALERKQ